MKIVINDNRGSKTTSFDEFYFWRLTDDHILKTIVRKTIEIMFEKNFLSTDDFKYIFYDVIRHDEEIEIIKE